MLEDEKVIMFFQFLCLLYKGRINVISYVIQYLMYGVGYKFCIFYLLVLIILLDVFDRVLDILSIIVKLISE